MSSRRDLCVSVDLHSTASDASAAAVTALEAAWALTNLAAADHGVAGAVLPAAPALILHLSGGSGVLIAQQAAWALGEHDALPLKVSCKQQTWMAGVNKGLWDGEQACGG